MFSYFSHEGRLGMGHAKRLTPVGLCSGSGGAGRHCHSLTMLGIFAPSQKTNIGIVTS